MKTIFTFKTNSRVRRFDLLVKNRSTEKYGSKSLMALGPKIWNRLPENIKKKHPLAKSRNILNCGQVRLASAKCAWVFTNYGHSLFIREVFRNSRAFEKEP